jgi:hypothetical protein
MMRSLPSAVALARLRLMAVATSTSSLLSSLVRCVAVGIPALATARVSSDAAPRRSLAAFPGAFLLADKVLPEGAGPPMMRLLPSAVAMARPHLMAMATSTSLSLSSLVRCIAVGIPALATARVSLDAAPRRSLAAFPGAVLPADKVLPMGVVRPPLRGFVGILNVALSPSLSSSSDRITSGPFSYTAASAVTRRKDFARRLAPSRFKDTRGIFPPGCFLAFRCHRPAIRRWKQSFATAVLPTPVLRVGLIFRAIVGAILPFT